MIRTSGVTTLSKLTSPLDGNRVAAVFKAVRAEMGLTQEDAARGADLTLAGYRPYEQGKRQLRLEQLDVFAKAFGISTDLLSARLGIRDHASLGGLRDIHVTECAEILSQLADEPPEVTQTILAWLRQSVQMAKAARTASAR